jgi:hypothetical protein
VIRPDGRRRVVRIVGPVIGAVVLLLPAGQATADDDPGPVEWPTVEQQDAGGNGSDPGAVEWPTVTQPENNDTANDPEPVDWPAPQQL